jgi:hypothetical protein
MNIIVGVVAWFATLSVPMFLVSFLVGYIGPVELLILTVVSAIVALVLVRFGVLNIALLTHGSGSGGGG